MRADDGLRIAAGAFVGAKSGIITAVGAEVPVFGLRNAGYIAPGQLVAVNRPIGISQIRFKFIPITAVTPTSMAFEIHKATTTSQMTGGTPGHQVQAVRKKTSGYPLIPLTEIDTIVSDTTGLTNAGNYIIVDDNPFDMAAGIAANSFESVWWFEDSLPLVIEQNEGILIHSTFALSAGTFQFFAGIEFYRF